MFETMYAAPGIGLAAIQIGVPQRVVTMDLAKKDEPKNPQVFINPEVIWKSAEQAAYERSLHPGLMHGWNGGANVGFSIARGNSQTENLALAFNAVHPTLNDKITESETFARDVQGPLFVQAATANAAAHDRGIKRAPFVVLIGASMPSVLAEIGFVSNAHDESVMRREEYRERTAEALYKGISSYAGSLSHFQVAQRH